MKNYLVSVNAQAKAWRKDCRHHTGPQQQPPNSGGEADFGPPSDTLASTFFAWAEAAYLETLGG